MDSLRKLYYNQICETYESSTHTDRVFLLTKGDIELTIKNISIDTSPGFDGIVLCTIRNVVY